MIPGEVITADGDLVLNVGRRTITLMVANSGDRPVQVGSHYHFAEVNPALLFERAQARVDPLLEALRRETARLGPEADSVLTFHPDEAPKA